MSAGVSPIVSDCEVGNRSSVWLKRQARRMMRYVDIRTLHRTTLGPFWLLLGWICAPLPAMAQGVGAIGGTIADISGAVPPGVTVTLSSPGTIGGNQEAVTTDRGTFLFPRLVPGRYSVRASLTGFRTPFRKM